jgi:hypothetical protein
VAEIVAVDALATGWAMTEKVTELDPSGTLTLPGAVALPLELAIATETAPIPLGTVDDIVSVAVAVPPPSSVVGESVSDDGSNGTRVTSAVTLEELRLATIVEVVCVATDLVRIEKETVLLPLGTVTDAGTVTLESLAWSVTAVPAEGAVPVSVTVPVTKPPATALVGLTVNDESWRVVIDTVPVTLLPL